MDESKKPFTLRLSDESIKRLSALALTYSLSKQNLLSVMIRNFRPEDHLEEIQSLMYAKYKTADQKAKEDELKIKQYLDSLSPEQLAELISSKR